MSLITSAWSHFNPVTASELVSRVATLYGVDGDTTLETRISGFLNEAINDANTHLWEFNKMEESGIVLTQSQNWVQVTDFIYREVDAFLVDTSVTPNRMISRLGFVPWVNFQASVGTGDQEGTPTAYSFFNLHRTGKVYLALTPDANTATNYTLTFQYYRRIPQLLEGEDPLQIPREMQQLLLRGAKRRLAEHLLGPAHPDVAAEMALENSIMDKLRGIDRRNPDENFRFRLSGQGRRWSLPTNNKLPYWWLFGGR